MLNGAFEHEDSTGSKGKMTAGAVQWMKTGEVLFTLKCQQWKHFQLWINMPAKFKKINLLITL